MFILYRHRHLLHSIFHTPDSSPERSKPGIRNYRKPGIASSKRPGIGSQMKWDSLHGGTYRYNPLGLGEIRVLHLLAGKKDDKYTAYSVQYRFRMSILVTQFPTNMQYRTIGNISHHWARFRSLPEPTNSRQHTRRYSFDPHYMPSFADCAMNRKIVLLWIDALCIYLDRYRMKDCRNLRFGPLFSEGFRFAS